MNIKEIKSIVDIKDLDDNTKSELILHVIAKDKKAIPTILSIIEIERKMNNELIGDSNAELSRALITLQDPNIGKKKPKPIVELDFVVNEIKKHYLKWEDTVRCNFKIKGLP